MFSCFIFKIETQSKSLNFILVEIKPFEGRKNVPNWEARQGLAFAKCCYFLRNHTYLFWGMWTMYVKFKNCFEKCFGVFFFQNSQINLFFQSWLCTYIQPPYMGLLIIDTIIRYDMICRHPKSVFCFYIHRKCTKSWFEVFWTAFKHTSIFWWNQKKILCSSYREFHTWKFTLVLFY